MTSVKPSWILEPITQGIFSLATNDSAFDDLELVAIGIENTVASDIKPGIDAKDSCFAFHELPRC